MQFETPQFNDPDVDGFFMETLKLADNMDVEVVDQPDLELPEESEGLSRSELIDSFELTEGQPFTRRNNVIESLESLAEQLREKVLDYDSIISDDSSGRLPSLVLWRYINEIRSEQDLDRILTYFITFNKEESVIVQDDPKGRTDRQVIVDFLKSKKEKLGRVLLVTDYIYSGGTIASAADIFEEVGIDFDVAAVSEIDTAEVTKDDRIGELHDEGKLMVGSSGGAGLAFYNRPVTGVTKKHPVSDTAPHPKKIPPYSSDKEKAAEDRRDIVKARRDIRKVADYLFNTFGRKDDK